MPLFSKDVTPSGFYNEVDILELGQIYENLNLVSVLLIQDNAEDFIAKSAQPNAAWIGENEV